jgi:hypothetical protein
VRGEKNTSRRHDGRSEVEKKKTTSIRPASDDTNTITAQHSTPRAEHLRSDDTLCHVSCTNGNKMSNRDKKRKRKK